MPDLVIDFTISGAVLEIALIGTSFFFAGVMLGVNFGTKE